MKRILGALESLMPLMVVLLLALVSGWLWKVVERNSPNDEGLPNHEPDLVLTQFSARQFSPEGVLRYTITAQKMVHYPDDDTSHFEGVVLSSVQPNAPLSTIKSREAVRMAREDSVLFSGAVVATQAASHDHPATILKTESMTVHPDRGEGETDQPVEILSGKNVLLSNGMTYNNNTRIGDFFRAKVTWFPPKH
jgi:lipopolysaccharide export system protein LptC